MNRFEKVISGTVILVAIGGMITALIDPIFFETQYAREDGIIETTTAIALFLAALTSFRRLFLLRKKRTWMFLTVVLLTGLAFVFGAGEEISWGQRYLGLETPKQLKSINTQGELNIHNIEIKGVRLNKLIFSQLLTVFLIIYFLVLPYLYHKKVKIREFCRKLAIPVAHNRQIYLYLGITILVSSIPQQRKWEVMEFAGSMLFWMILLYPKNVSIFEIENSQNKSGE